MNSIKIGQFEAFAFMTIMMLSKVFFSSIRTLSHIAGTAGYQVSAVSVITALGAFGFLYLLIKRFDGSDIVTICEKVLGNIGSKVVCVVFVAYGVYYCAINVREAAELIKSYHLPSTPVNVLVGAFLLAVVAIALGGIVNMTRVSSFCLWGIVGAIIFILVLSIPQYQVENLYPIWGEGIGTTVSYGLLRCSAYGDIFVLTVMASQLKNVEAFKKVGIKAILVSGGLITLCTLCYAMAFHYNISDLGLSPILEMVKRIYFNRFFQRFEAIFLVVFVISAIINVGAYFWASQTILCKAFRIPFHHMVAAPMFFAVYAVSLMPKNFTQILEVHLVVIRQYSFVLEFGLPICILILAALEGKKGGQLHEIH